MDKTIRRNEVCVIGMPRCDFVFSSTRACFIAYGFEESPLEMTIIGRILEERGIQAVEAGGSLAPGQSAFCSKICSKIILAQFCVVLLNNEESDGTEIPNANVNMEYGLMLGFNKYVIPFQRASQKLPFNVAGLDTIKYTSNNFENLAVSAIEQAIRETQQDAPPMYSPDQVLEAFLLTRNALVTPLNNEGERDMYQMGQPLGFNLLNDFSAMKHMYFGNFSSLRPEVVNWRVRKLMEIIDQRRASIGARIQVGVATQTQADVLNKVLDELQVWIAVTSNEDKEKVKSALGSTSYSIEVFSIDDMGSALEALSTTIGAST